MDPFDKLKMEVDEHMVDDAINLNQVLEIVKKPMIKDEYWYLVDKKWYEQCEQFICDNEPTHNPGPIDNTNLFKSKTNSGWKLKNDLEDETDYKIIPEEAWLVLVRYFGIRNEKHTIKRLVIDEGSHSSYCVVEVYPIELTLCEYSQSRHVVDASYSRATTLRSLEEEMKQMFTIDAARGTQLYQNKTLLIAHADRERETFGIDQTLAQASIYSGNDITIEVQNIDGSWPSSRPRTTRNSTMKKKSYLPGVCGLTNLGNTCFMNSALQCLSNTPPLTEFMTSNKYLDEINEENPLGMQGKIARAYGDMIKNMWSGNENVFTPREFKFAVGSFAPQFSGFAQQDCQELMAFLLDGLHEDLNRIKKKPYIEVKTDIDTRPNHIVAQESWENYKKRNDSIIVDTFHGLLKSTLVCPDCHLVSVTFDPFCYLSLPLPVKRDTQINVILVPAYVKSDEGNGNGNEDIKAVKITRLTIPKYGSIIDISNAVAKEINDARILLHQLDPSKLLVTEVHNHRLYKVFEKDEAIVTNNEDLVVYELSDDKLSIPVYLREIRPDGTVLLFGRPIFIGINDSQYETIRESVDDQLRRFMKAPVSVESSDSDEGVAECPNGGQLISLSLINSFGTIDFEELVENKPIELNSNSYMALNLPTKSKTRYFNEAEQDKFYKINAQKGISQQKNSIPLSDCIMNFTTTEKLGADDPWYCPACKKHQQATKKFDLWDLPNVLIIHLKRFSYSRYYRDKLDSLVDYPVTGLNMGKYAINNPEKTPILYDLIAVNCCLIVSIRLMSNCIFHRSQIILVGLVVVIIPPMERTVKRITGTISMIQV